MSKEPYLFEFSRKSLRRIQRKERRLGIHFSKEKDKIYGVLEDGDTIHLEEKNGISTLTATVKNIKFYPNLNEEKIRAIKDTCNCALTDDEYPSRDSLLEDDEFWNEVKTSKYATLFGMRDVKTISIQD